MGLDLKIVGRDWLVGAVSEMVDTVERLNPVEFNERDRWLPSGVTPRPGPIRYNLFPFLKEPLNCFDPRSPVREVNFRKGAQVGYTTLLESIMFYVIAHLKTIPMMFLTADGELASGRMENNIIPMLNDSGKSELIRSADIGNKRKTGKTKDHLQWDGGGFMIYDGALNAAKMRSWSVPVILKDEVDGWPHSVGKDGNSDVLTNERATSYWEVRKILRGSTPLVYPSLIDSAYLRGDQREYLVLCKRCSFPQVIRHRKPNTETGVICGFHWETEEDRLIHESVRYCCVDCGEAHFEYDKEKLFATEEGARWKPTAIPKEANIRSYGLPAFYSPVGFRPWSKCISDLLDSFDVEAKQVTDFGKYQTYVNNTLGRPYRQDGAKIRFRSVSSHRRAEYRFGQIPNEFAAKYSGSKILFLTCQVDVHKKNLAVAVYGWTVEARSYVVDYWRFEVKEGEPDCTELDSPVWGRLRQVIEEKIYTADDGTRYSVALTLVDAGYSNATVSEFCADYVGGVYPILGRPRPTKSQSIKEFGDFTTQMGTLGYKVTVDHYKERLAPVLRRSWVPEAGDQPKYHFNAPIDITDKQLTELTVEELREGTDDKGNVTREWYRPPGAKNELWDLSVYGHASVEILAWSICIKQFGFDTVKWDEFWNYAMDDANKEIFCRLA